MTDKLRAAAELALECLEELQGGCTDSNDGTVEAITVWCPEVIDALRTALAEPEPYDQTTLELCDVCGWKTLIPGDGCLNCERQPKAEQPAEPVAWMPIATAPKGRIVLVYYKNTLGNGRTMRARYYLPETLDSDITESGWADEGWYEESEAYEYLMPLDHEPTHWMPLPAAPDTAPHPKAEQEPAPGYCKHCKQYTIEEPLPAEQEPYCYTYTENGEEYFAPPTAYVPDHAKPLYTASKPAKPVEPVTHSVIAGALFDFAGYMTTRSKVIDVGSTADAAPVADLVKEWANLRGLSLDDAAVLSWQEWLPTAPQPAKAEPQGEPFKPDWVNYRQGLHDGWAEGYEQGVADERASEATIGIAGFGAKVSPARVNPYKSTEPQPTKQPLTEDEAKAIAYVGPVYAPDGVVTRYPLEYRKELEQHRLDAIRRTEAAHGITGETK